MVFFPWSQDYSVGIRVIDNDHKELVDAINNLHRAIQKGVADGEVDIALTFLARYVRDHFRREETLMADCGYPDLMQHKAQHRKLARTVHAIRKVHAQHPHKIDPDKLMEFLRNWLVHHIAGADMKYIPYLLGDAKGDTFIDDPGPGPGGRRQNGAIAVQVKVPPDKVELIQRCAALLNEGGRTAKALEELADPLTGMTLQEAAELVKHLLHH